MNVLTVENSPRLALWVAALRSGNFDQIHNSLVKNLGGEKVGYCCLGVGCVKAGAPRRTIEGGAEWAFVNEDGRNPRSFTEWLGLEWHFSKTLRVADDTEMPLFVLNDSSRMTFEEIADEVETYGVIYR